MKQLLFGYGSLINLESASRTLKRTITQQDVYTGYLKGYQRNWTLWDEVVATSLDRQVKGVFLNVMPVENAFLNGVLFEINDEELEYFITREKNYTCTEITQQVTFDNATLNEEYGVVTFVGNGDYLITENTADFFIFDKYLNIVNKGVQEFGEAFGTVFNDTTTPGNLTILSGSYTFVDNEQQKAR